MSCEPSRPPTLRALCRACPDPAVALALAAIAWQRATWAAIAWQRATWAARRAGPTRKRSE